MSESFRSCLGALRGYLSESLCFRFRVQGLGFRASGLGFNSKYLGSCIGCIGAREA